MVLVPGYADRQRKHSPARKITATMFMGSESLFDEDAPYQAGAWADEVVQGDNVRTIGDVFLQQASAIHYALADRLYLTYRAVVFEYADPDDHAEFPTKKR